MVGNQSSEYRKRSVMLQDIGVHFNKGNLMFANELAKNPKVFLFKSGGRRPPRHIHNPIELMFFTRWSGQRIDTGLIFFRQVRPGSQLHRPDTEASQIAEVHLSDRILQDEGESGTANIS